MPFRSLAADDIFISYTRLDASTYAAGLADELTKKGFSCFIDKLGTDPNKDLPDMLRRKVRSCAMLVVVGTDRAATRQTIADEVGEFLKTGRGSSIVPIDFGGSVYRANWYPLVEGIAPEPENNALALDDGEPSPSVLSRIEKQFNYTRRSQRLRRAAISMAVVLGLLLLAGVGAAVYARQQIVLANAERARAIKAREEADRARSEANTAREAADLAKNDAIRERANAAEQKTKADAAEVRAGEAVKREQVARELEAKATANARLQETIGSSRARATVATYFGAAEPDNALTESVEAYRIYPTVEARGSLLSSLQLYPNLVGLARENPNPIVSLASCHNGAVLVSSDDTGLILFWDAARKRVLKRVEPRAKKHYGVSIACAPGGSLCAADDLAGKLTVWDVNPRGSEYEVIERLSYPSLTPINIPVQITPVFAGLNLLVMIGEARTYNRKQDVILVDLDQAGMQPIVKTLTVPADVTREEFGVARELTINPATKMIAIGFNHGVALWHMDALDRPATWIRPPEEWIAKRELISSLALSPDGKYLAVSSVAGSVAVWTLSDEKPKLVNQPHKEAGTFVAFFNQTQNGREATYMVTAYRGGQISLWDPWNAPVWQTSFEPDVSALTLIDAAGKFATGSSDGLLALWDMARVSPLHQMLPRVNHLRAFAFGRTSGLLYAASDSKNKDDSESRLWRAQGGRYEPLVPGERRPEFTAGEFGLQLLSEVSSDYINLRDIYGGRPDEIRVEIKHTPKAPRAVSPDGRTLAIGESATRPWNISEVEPTSIVLWDISNKAQPRRVNSLNFDGRPVSLFFADDGSTLAASYDNGKIVIWDYRKGTRRKQIAVPKAQSPEPGRRYNVGRIALSPDGRLLAGMTYRGIGLWDVATGLLLGKLGLELYWFRNAEDLAGSMIFSRDGKTLVVLSVDGFDVWNLNADTWAAMAADITSRR